MSARLINNTLLLEVAGPLVVFYGARALGADQLVALLLGTSLSLVSAAMMVRRERRVSSMTVFVLGTMALSVAMSFITGSPRALLVRAAWGTAALGVWLLITLLTRRPFIYEGARIFSTGPDRERWEANWSESPAFRHVMRAITVIFGIGLLADAAIRVLLALYLPIDLVPLLDDVLLLVTLAALALVARTYARAHLRARGLRLRGAHLTPT